MENINLPANDFIQIYDSELFKKQEFQKNKREEIINEIVNPDSENKIEIHSSLIEYIQLRDKILNNEEVSKLLKINLDEIDPNIDELEKLIKEDANLFEIYKQALDKKNLFEIDNENEQLINKFILHYTNWKPFGKYDNNKYACMLKIFSQVFSLEEFKIFASSLNKKAFFYKYHTDQLITLFSSHHIQSQSDIIVGKIQIIKNRWLYSPPKKWIGKTENDDIYCQHTRKDALPFKVIKKEDNVIYLQDMSSDRESYLGQTSNGTWLRVGLDKKSCVAWALHETDEKDCFLVDVKGNPGNQWLGQRGEREYRLRCCQQKDLAVKWQFFNQFETSLKY